MIKKITDLDLKNKTVLIRADLNVPIDDGQISSDLRIKASMPTIRYALEHGAGVILMSHLGRPKEGAPTQKDTLRPVADYLAKNFGQVRFCDDYLDNPPKAQAGELILLQNVRFNVGEKANDDDLAKKYAALCDIFVMDAFGTAHRAQASTSGVAVWAKKAGKAVCAGLLLDDELTALQKALHAPKAPVVAIVGGAKVSSKLQVLHQLAKLCDQIIVGGGIANTFLAATGVNVGTSLYEPEFIDDAKQIMQHVEVLLPTHVVVTKKAEVDFDDFIGSLKNAAASKKAVGEVADDELILDSDAGVFVAALLKAKTILWNGPLGVFEVASFGDGTKQLAHTIAQSDAYSIAGGGDTLAAVDHYGVQENISYLSTGGGAFLEFVEGKRLPGIVALGESC